MQFELPLSFIRPRPAREDWLLVGSRQIRLHLVRNRRARRYVLRLRPDGSARVTVPRGGSQSEAKRFAAKNGPWLEKELLRQATRPRTPVAWLIGTQILFRGEPTHLEPGLNGEPGLARLGTEAIRVRDLAADLRPEIEGQLWRLAAREFPPRVLELAALHQLPVKHVSVRNQRSRWGSCSRRGTISLNWRLIQTPVFVRDYLIFHELAHLKEMNHSRRFWREVERLCPNFSEAERWLKKHSDLLR